MSKMHPLYLCLFYTAAMHSSDTPPDDVPPRNKAYDLEIERQVEREFQQFCYRNKILCEASEADEIERRDRELVLQKMVGNIAGKAMFYVKAVSGLFGALALVGIGCLLINNCRNQKVNLNGGGRL